MNAIFVNITSILQVLISLLWWHLCINPFWSSSDMHALRTYFYPFMSLVGFPAFFFFESPIILRRHYNILVNFITIWSVLKLPKLTWPGSFNFLKTLNSRQDWLCYCRAFSLAWPAFMQIYIYIYIQFGR